MGALTRERHLFDIMDQGCALIRGGGGEGAYSGGERSLGGCALIRGGEGAYSRKYRNCMIESNSNVHRKLLFNGSFSKYFSLE